MDWVKEGINYWENPDCPIEYLEGALVRLVNEVEGVELPIEYFKGQSREFLQREIEHYEYVADK
ncbi:hypothetical protein V7128_01770 [Neobacillus vireti]|uniref:hypothetical protein n=1 Tax=Neobacillus vireti TaxID=220686 RepID=UPI0030002C40